MKLSEKEYKKNQFKKLNFLAKMLFYTWIINLKVVDKKVWNNNNDYSYKIRTLNPYNPISYIVFILMFFFFGLINGFGNLTKKDIKDLFKFC